MKTVLLASTMTLLLASCHKTSSCYDAALAKAFQAKDCTMHYAPVTGCDGKTYSNECIANTNGIKVK